MKQNQIRALEREYEEEEAEDPRDSLLRRILGALNRSRLMPYPRSTLAAREFSRLCSEYKNRYGHLTIPASLPLRMIRQT